MALVVITSVGERFMRNLIQNLVFLSFLASFAVQGAQFTPEEAQTVSRRVVELLREHHVSPPQFADISKEFFDQYLDVLDSQKILFLKSDIEEFQSKYQNRFYSDAEKGELADYEAIRSRFEDRYSEFRKKAEVFLSSDPTISDFSKDETVEIPYKDWAQDDAAHTARVRLAIRAQLLDAKVADENLDVTKERLKRRFARTEKQIRQETESSSKLSQWLNALSSLYDPHSDYFDPSEAQSFGLKMNLAKLVGIGAALSSDDGYVTVQSVVPGGPAHLDGRLKAGDRILAVAQEGAEPVDVVEMPLDKAIAMIRGEIDTVVALKVEHKGEPGKTLEIVLKRKPIETAASGTTAQIYEVRGRKIGVIQLQEFYGGCAKDVEKLLKKLKEASVDGVVLDLRNDGGGALDEAIRIAGFFINGGPIVAATDRSYLKDPTHVEQMDDPQWGVVYRGPLMVFVNHGSASASEITAAALQDYGRAIIVGDEVTHGKGTIQTYAPLDQGRDLGRSKFTVGRFFRITGQTTQKYGVRSDIALPSIYDGLKLGEQYLPHVLEPITINPMKFDKFNMGYINLDELKKASSARVAQTSEFRYLIEDKNKRETAAEEKVVHFSEEMRRSKIAAYKASDEERKKERASRKAAYALKEEFSLVSQGPKIDREKNPMDYCLEAQLEEGLSIFGDWLDQRAAHSTP